MPRYQTHFPDHISSNMTTITRSTSKRSVLMTCPGPHYFSNIGILATCPGPKPTFNTTMAWRSHSVPATFAEELHSTIASRLQLNKNHYIYPIEFQDRPFNDLPSSQLHLPHGSFRHIPRYQTHFPYQLGSTITTGPRHPNMAF